jgi:hypothetical protein
MGPVRIELSSIRRESSIQQLNVAVGIAGMDLSVWYE